MEDVTTEDAASNDTTTPNEAQLTAGETTTGAGTSTHFTSTNNIGSSSTSRSGLKSAYTLDDANEEISQLIISGKVTSDDVKCLKSMLKEHTSLKEKVEKLKSLLGRSAKAQREAKVDYEKAQKSLGQAMREIERLNRKLEKLQTRPSHLDLLMDFETNFDKALLSVGQTGGQDTAATSEPNIAGTNIRSSIGEGTNSHLLESNLDTMLMQELGEAKSRIEKLETLNGAMMSRSTQLEHGTKTLEIERDDAINLSKRLQMELRMANLESEQAHRAMMDKVASLEEMQIEIDLVTKASSKASARAAKGEEATNSLKTEKNHIQQLESQCLVLNEWALASSDAKQLMKERCKILENKLKLFQGRSLLEGGVGGGNKDTEKLLFSKVGSMVIGAGDIGSFILSLGEYASTIDTRFVILRWKFDVAPSDSDIDFNIIKGKCETDFVKADHIIKDRVIKGGAGGESEGAFNYDSACTVLWSNKKSWIRPKTVKYFLDVIALK